MDRSGVVLNYQQNDEGQSKGEELRHYREVGGRWPYLSIPSRLIFDSSVCRGIPSLAAAPDGPDIRPWLSARAASIISTSRSASADNPSCERGAAADSLFSQLSST